MNCSRERRELRTTGTRNCYKAAESRIRGPMESKTGRELAGETEVVVRGKLLNTEINGGGVVWAMTRSIG